MSKMNIHMCTCCLSFIIVFIYVTDVLVCVRIFAFTPSNWQNSHIYLYMCCIKYALTKAKNKCVVVMRLLPAIAIHLKNKALLFREQFFLFLSYLIIHFLLLILSFMMMLMLLLKMSESEIVQKCTDATNNTHSLIQSNKNCSWMIKSNWINKTEYYTNGMLKNTKTKVK